MIDDFVVDGDLIFLEYADALQPAQLIAASIQCATHLELDEATYWFGEPVEHHQLRPVPLDDVQGEWLSL